MLTPPSPTSGRRSPAVSAAVSGLRFSSPTSPTYSISISLIGVLGHLAGEAAEHLGERDPGLQDRRLLGGDATAR